MTMDTITRFLDNESKIKILPVKKEARIAVLKYLATKFDFGRDYTEKDINRIIDSWHTFGDYFLLRRELVDAHFLSREMDGSRYWKEEILTNDAP